MKKAWTKNATFLQRKAKRAKIKEISAARLKKHHKKIEQSLHRSDTHARPYICIKAPKQFSIIDQDSRHELFVFLGKMRKNIHNSNRQINLDFSATESMVSSATLLFKAELCRSLKLSKTMLIPKIKPPRSTKIDQVLKQIGIYELVDYTSKVVPNHPDVVNWRYANGYEVMGKKYDEILGHFDGVICESLASSLYLGITEAMTNCHHHAYIDKRDDGLNLNETQKNWWMFSQEKDGTLDVVFGDLGVGIPVSLPIKKPGVWNNIKKKLGVKPRDSDIISEAILQSKSRTGKNYRGKGLKQLVETIESIEDAKLLLFSNKGLYSHMDDTVKVYNFHDSIYGTLVYWSVPIKQKESNNA